MAHPAIRNRGTTVGSIAHADAAGEMPAILALTDGVVEAAGPQGRREIATSDFFQGPLETALAEDEMATAVRFGLFPAGTATAFAESARRHGDYAMAGVAAAVTVADGVVHRALASFVSVTDVPSVLDLTDLLQGQEPASADWSTAAEAVRAHVEPEADIHASAEYRRMLAGELARRVLAQAAVTALGQPQPRRTPQRRRTQHAMTDLTTEQLHDVTVYVNGVARSASVPARRLLSDFLRHDLGLTGTHVGCEHGVCGACTVLVDGQPMRSCLMFAVTAQDHRVTTVEGSARRPTRAPARPGNG